MHHKAFLLPGVCVHVLLIPKVSLLYLVTCRLKGVRPIGEAVRWIIATAILTVTKGYLQDAVGTVQIN